MFTIFLHGLGIITCSGSMKILLFLSYQLLLTKRERLGNHNIYTQDVVSKPTINH